ncbi:hypothetical protein [Pseudoalteromonas denitrificans]|nr:hypothetical protein [Pseudoalteromonas denitrificans]
MKTRVKDDQVGFYGLLLLKKSVPSLKYQNKHDKLRNAGSKIK